MSKNNQSAPNKTNDENILPYLIIVFCMVFGGIIGEGYGLLFGFVLGIVISAGGMHRKGGWR